MKVRYVLKCRNCGAAAADCVRLCPYCGESTGIEGLGLRRSSDGGLVIEKGTGVVVGSGSGEKRDCPFCGASVEVDTRFCPFCKEKVVIEQMRAATLRVESGGSLKVHPGASLKVVGRRRLAVHEASAANNCDAIKAAVIDGDDPDHPDESGGRPLHYAAARDAAEAARYLISVGADVDAIDDRKHTALHVAAGWGSNRVVEVLLMVGASLTVRDERGLTPAELAMAHHHPATSKLLGAA